MRCAMSAGSAMYEVAEKFVAEVRRLANENPEFVYQKRPIGDGGEGGSCMYVNEAGTGGDCLIGQAVINTGLMSVEELGKHENELARGLLGDLRFPGAATQWADRVQSRQDMGVAWVDAVRDADLTFPLPKSLAALPCDTGRHAR
ncbi:hypothetical protein L3Y19_gp046 [Gordonia phage Neville]|uniref:Uncharacterized protein n=1 Tax=Gordonia phage Neville TaxID=2301693 RepID=A0A385DY87_9CAUD|nr:hypothetical protein L3Y19_gp046 [Gordonia phage Neville]AXQ64416.1 hypothetical protein SEA_NEVILLE_46 [Gordonia phage Neville]